VVIAEVTERGGVDAVEGGDAGGGWGFLVTIVNTFFFSLLVLWLGEGIKALGVNVLFVSGVQPDSVNKDF
jgi:hypothetical protein